MLPQLYLLFSHHCSLNCYIHNIITTITLKPMVQRHVGSAKRGGGGTYLPKVLVLVSLDHSVSYDCLDF